MTKQFRLEQAFWQTRTIHRHQRFRCAAAGFMHRAGHQFLAGARFAQQKHRGLGRRHPCHQTEHVHKRRAAADQPLRGGLTLCHPQGFHFFHIKALLATGIEQRCEFNVDVFLAFGRVVQVQHAFALARFTRTRQRAGLTGLITRHAETV